MADSLAIDLAMDSIRWHEGWRAKPYRDTAGKLTIGYGRNLDDVGISLEEGQYLLENDLRTAMVAARGLFRSFPQLSPQRKAVLIEMALNLGAGSLYDFVRMRAAVDRGDFDAAADEMLDSKWARQVGFRAEKLARIMRGQ